MPEADDGRRRATTILSASAAAPGIKFLMPPSRHQLDARAIDIDISIRLLILSAGALGQHTEAYRHGHAMAGHHEYMQTSGAAPIDYWPDIMQRAQRQPRGWTADMPAHRSAGRRCIGLAGVLFDAAPRGQLSASITRADCLALARAGAHGEQISRRPQSHRPLLILARRPAGLFGERAQRVMPPPISHDRKHAATPASPPHSSRRAISRSAFRARRGVSPRRPLEPPMQRDELVIK